MVPREKSAAESKTITEEIVQPIEETITGKKTITDDAVRKWAHGLEFAVLGFELILLLEERKAIKAFSYGVGIALLDETIQLIGDRGPLISDVWIDAAGLTIGMVLGLVILLITRNILLKKTNST